jgi:regulator of sigma E protease
LETLNTIWNIAKIALGLGFVIFIHELGHFLLAKWNGVKVEKFSIGFGPTIFGFRRGETEYVLALFPLGGFVKMLGEGADSEETVTTDPRAFPNKSVSARMAIISAGVLMNLLFGGLCFAYVFGQEREVPPAVIGAVFPGSPAYEAGLRPHDEIVTIDGKRDLTYDELRQKVVLSADGQVLHFEVKRAGHEGLIGLDIKPPRESGSDHPTIGILPEFSLRIAGFEPLPGMESPPAYPTLSEKERESKVDVLVAAAPEGESPEPLADITAYERLAARYADRPIRYVIERRIVSPSEHAPSPERFEITLPPNHYIDLGLRLAIEPTSAVRKDSPAEKAGFRKGDLITKVDGRDDFDPVRLPTLCYQNAGKPMTFEVERKTGSDGTTTEVLTVTPDDTPLGSETLLPHNELFDIPSLGLCYAVSPHVVAVRPGSSAAAGGLKPHDVINSVTFPALKAASSDPGRSARSTFKARTINFEEKTPGWSGVFAELQVRPREQAEFVVNKASSPIKIVGEPQNDWYNPDRGLIFDFLRATRPPQRLGAALANGFQQTLQSIGLVYSSIRRLVERRVGLNNLGGPIMIVDVAYSAARSGFQSLVYFLGFLSVNLAVLNFLPILPLDGGQMVYLLAEKIRGRPLPASAMVAGLVVGVFLLLCLMVFVTFQDVLRLVNG